MKNINNNYMLLFIIFIFLYFGFFKIFVYHNNNNNNMGLLPIHIDYTQYTSTQGMGTSVWGPNAWDFLFISIMGRYPVKVDFYSKEDVQIVNVFSQTLIGLKDLMPCIYCRKSFENFIKELPIEPYLIGRIELMYWLYLIKDKVNKKLICQENICYNDEKIRLKGLYHHGDIIEQEYYSKIKEFKETTSQTVPTPPFKDVLDKYENFRALCSQKSLSCVLVKPRN
jgi:hypothetical protein